MRVAIGSLLAVLLPGPLWGACVNSERNAGQFVGYEGFNPANENSCGRLVGNDILVCTLARNDTGSTIQCDQSSILTDVIAHQLGHLLGLEDSTCSGYAMSQTSFTAGGSYINRSVKSAECSKLREVNATPTEFWEDLCQTHPDSPQCSDGPPCDPCGSPIVLDLDGGGFEFTDVHDGVSFDIDGDGRAERVSWIARGSGDALLCLDRNGNGRIEGGQELFGDATPFLDGHQAENGYQALYELDLALGNGNGFVDPQDPFFDSLCLWIDANHNGTSEPSELAGLDAHGFQAIATGYRITLRADEYGNWSKYLSYASAVRGSGELEAIRTVDVLFTTRGAATEDE